MGPGLQLSKVDCLPQSSPIIAQAAVLSKLCTHQSMEVLPAECICSAADCSSVLEELIGSGLVQHFESHLALPDLQSLVSVNTALREWTDSLAQPDWQAIRKRFAPASHYLASVLTGASTTTRGQSAWPSCG